MEKSTNTTAHKWLAKVIQEFGSAEKLSKLTEIPERNFYYWRDKEINEGDDLIKRYKYVNRLQKQSKFKSLALKLMPSSKYF